MDQWSGEWFMTENGRQEFIKGEAYSGDREQCDGDATVLAELDAKDTTNDVGTSKEERERSRSRFDFFWARWWGGERGCADY